MTHAEMVAAVEELNRLHVAWDYYSPQSQRDFTAAARKAVPWLVMLAKEALLAATINDDDVWTEEEKDAIARIAVALNMSPARWPGIATTELHRDFISLLNKTKALRAHVEHMDRKLVVLGAALEEIKEEANRRGGDSYTLRDIAKIAADASAKSDEVTAP